MQELTLIQPDDWHLHLRDGAAMAAVLPDTVARFGRAIVMPNLKPPVTTVAAAAEYRERILSALPIGSKFEPLMTLYLTDNTSPEEIRKARASGFVHAVKYYPAGATTNSDAGVTNIRKCDAVFDAMQECGLPLLLHGEVNDGDVDVFDREAEFIERHLKPLVAQFPGLRAVLEHITTEQAADFVSAAGPNVAATVTAHHLLLNRNAIFKGGLRPHHYCLPILKREVHRLALVKAATSGNSKFFLGTDSAPHARSGKESHCCGAGIYTAHAGIELYAELFAAEKALDKLEGFASRHGPAFYGLPVNDAKVTLLANAWKVPERLPFLDNDPLTPLRAGEDIGWQLVK
jgi:dihydroorotase